jgi:hypothetical protein
VAAADGIADPGAALSAVCDSAASVSVTETDGTVSGFDIADCDDGRLVGLGCAGTVSDLGLGLEGGKSHGDSVLGTGLSGNSD